MEWNRLRTPVKAKPHIWAWLGMIFIAFDLCGGNGVTFCFKSTTMSMILEYIFNNGGANSLQKSSAHTL